MVTLVRFFLQLIHALAVTLDGLRRLVIVASAVARNLVSF